MENKGCICSQQSNCRERLKRIVPILIWRTVPWMSESPYCVLSVANFDPITTNYYLDDSRGDTVMVMALPRIPAL